MIGVIEDGKCSSLSSGPEPYLVLPLTQSEYVQRVNLVAKTRDNPRAIVEPLLSEVQALAPGLPSSTVLTMPEYLQYSIGNFKAPAVLVSLFGLIALLLGSVGLYGVMYHSVNQRTREFGVRLALGATEEGVVRMVLGQGLKTTLIGVGVGLVLALMLARAVAGLLLDVSALDPVVFTLVAATMLAIGQFASYLPARSASRIDPVATLRAE